MKRFIVLILISFLAFGCGTSKVKLTGCNHYSGWCNEIREVSSKSWKYAQLSKNVYNQTFQYNVSDYFTKLKEYPKNDIDFYAVLYEDKFNNDLVLVFRGTDSKKDFLTGNNPFKQTQNNHALKIFDEIRAENNNKRNYIVAGHSLGGGISIHISLNRKNVIAYSFNGSPVFRNINDEKNKRYSIVERGEILKLVRTLGREAGQLYTSIKCRKEEKKNGLIARHDMRSLANCLTQIGAIEDKEARQSLIKNNLEFKYPPEAD